MIKQNIQKLKLSNSVLGIGIACMACVFFGASGTVARFGIINGGSTSTMMVVQALSTACIAWTLSGYQGTTLSKKSISGLLLLGAVSGINGICMLEGYTRLGVAPVSIINATYPGIVGIYIWIAEKKRPSISWFISLVIALGGVFLAMQGTGSSYKLSWEYIFPITSAITLAIHDLIVQRTVIDIPPARAIAWVNVFVTVFALVIYNEQAILYFNNWQNWLFGALLGAVMYTALWMKFTGISYAGARLVSLMAPSQPIWAILIAFIVLNERLSIYQTIGAGLVVTALTIIAGQANKLSSTTRETS